MQLAETAFLVTGATDGIGRATALALAEQGASVILHGRDPAKLAAVCADTLAQTGNRRLYSEIADFASLADVAALADRVRAGFTGLNVLINNAGLLTDHRQVSADGFELTFAVNYLAPVLLTLKLLTTLESNAPARIVNVASTALGGGRIDFSNLQLEQGFEGWQAYANSKLMNVLFSNVLARRLSGKGVVSNALCPGLIDTHFFHTNTLFSGGQYDRMKGHMRPADEGALVSLYLATDPAAAHENGSFFIREGRDGRRVLPLEWDVRVANELWRRSIQYLEPWLTPADVAALPGGC